MVRTDLDFDYDAADDVYQPAYIGPAALQSPVDAVVQTLGADG